MVHHNIIWVPASVRKYTLYLRTLSTDNSKTFYRKKQMYETNSRKPYSGYDCLWYMDCHSR